MELLWLLLIPAVCIAVFVGALSSALRRDEAERLNERQAMREERRG